MTERDMLSNLDPDHRELEELRIKATADFVRLVLEPKEQNAAALQASFDGYLHKLSNMTLSTTTDSVLFATKKRADGVKELQQIVNDLVQTTRELSLNMKALQARQERLLKWFNDVQHDHEAMKAELAAQRGLIAEMARQQAPS